jgi:hypothetical protein
MLFKLSLNQEYSCDLGVYNTDTHFFESWESTELSIGFYGDVTLDQVINTLMDRNNVDQINVTVYI